MSSFLLVWIMVFSEANLKLIKLQQHLGITNGCDLHVLVLSALPSGLYSCRCDNSKDPQTKVRKKITTSLLAVNLNNIDSRQSHLRPNTHLLSAPLSSSRPRARPTSRSLSSSRLIVHIEQTLGRTRFFRPPLPIFGGAERGGWGQRS